MTARGFATVVGVWPAASKQVVRLTPAPDGGWKVLPVGPVPPIASDVLDVPRRVASSKPDVVLG